MNPIDFDSPDLVQIIESLGSDELGHLPFGAVKLDALGKVVVYSEAERRLSGYDRESTIGLDFFKQVAPCMDTPDYGRRLEAARRAGKVDIEIGWVGDFNDHSRELQVRMLSASDGGVWIFMNRLE